jgi:hypothetical protein
VLARIDAMHMSWMAELRRVTVIFVNLASLTYQLGQVRATSRIAWLKFRGLQFFG